MIPGYSAVAQHAVAEIPAAIDASVANPLRLFLQNPEAALVFLLIARPAVIGAASTFPYAVASQPVAALTSADAEPDAPLYLSDVGWQSPNSGSESNFAAGDTSVPANRNFPPRLQTAYDYEVRIPIPGAREGNRSVGAITIENTDGALDSWLTSIWGGRSVEVKIGGLDFSFSQFETLFKGSASDLTWTPAGIRIDLRDQLDELRLPLPTATYLGTGGLEGGAELFGLPKPRAWGQVRNVSAPMVDTTNRIVQLNAGAIQAVQAARDNGVALAFDADYADITTAAPGAGQYATSLATGYARVGSAPVGALTWDYQGDAAGGYVSSVSAIVQRILETDLGYADAVGGGFGNLPTYVVGYFTGVQQVTPAEIFDALIESVGGWWVVDRSGRMQVGVFDAPGVEKFLFDEKTIAAIDRVQTPQPAWSWRLGYQRMWTVQSADSLAAAVSESDRLKYSSEQRWENRASTAIKSQYPAARPAEATSLLDVLANAATEADRRWNRDRTARDLYRVRTVRHVYQIQPGDTVRVAYPRFGLTAGRNFVVVGMVENSRERIAQLTLWG